MKSTMSRRSDSAAAKTSPHSCATGSLGCREALLGLRKHLVSRRGAASIEFGKAIPNGRSEGLLRLKQPQAFREHVALCEKPPLGNEALDERGEIGRDIDGHDVQCSAL